MIATGELTNGTEHQQRPSSPFLHQVEAGYCRSHVDDIRDHGDGEGILDTRVLEVRCAKIEDEVHAWIGLVVSQRLMLA